MAVAHIENARIAAAGPPVSVEVTEHPHGAEVATDD
jgi:hypothetical protein